ncbi:MAG TPA: hypothetical protein DDW42_00715 [Desulfobacteraceae bacterium]|nr:hypothetical protein [Desulfobacteraceae bacterium]
MKILSKGGIIIKKCGLFLVAVVMALVWGGSTVMAGNWPVVLVDVQGDFAIWKKGSLAVAESEEAYVKKVGSALRDLKGKTRISMPTRFGILLSIFPFP